MNQGEARNFVLKVTVESLRKAAMHPGRILKKGTQRDMERVTKECERLATKLDKGGRTSEPEARTPGAVEGPDDLSQKPDAAPEGDTPAAECVYKP